MSVEYVPTHTTVGERINKGRRRGERGDGEGQEGGEKGTGRVENRGDGRMKFHTWISLVSWVESGTLVAW